MGGVNEPSMDTIRGELYVRRSAASSKSEIDRAVVVRGWVFSWESGCSYICCRNVEMY